MKRNKWSGAIDMATLGQQLQAARERKKLTPSEAAKGTRIKIQHIEALEHDDFSGVAAPAYARGFIRIYAEFLGIDPGPLIREYTELHMPPERPLMDEKTLEDVRGENPYAVLFKELWAKIDWSWIKKIRIPRRKLIIVGMGILVFVAFLVVLNQCAKRPRAEKRPKPVLTVPAPSDATRESLPLIAPVPDPYLP